MLIKDIDEIEEFKARDNSIIKEILLPDKDDVSIKHSIAFAVVKKGESTLKHKLKGSEIYIIVCGEGKMHIDEETENVKQGQIVYIPPNSVQFIENIGDVDLKFYCTVDPAWNKEDEEILE